MKSGMSKAAQPSPVDIAILVPKTDELAALKRVFGIPPRRRSSGVIGKQRFWLFKLPEAPLLSLAVVLLQDQGNMKAISVTKSVLLTLDPTVVFLVGTAVGREKKIKLGDVVVSERVLDAQEHRLEDADSIRSDDINTPPAARLDAEQFIEDDAAMKKWREMLGTLCSTWCPEAKPVKDGWKDLRAKSAHIVSSNDLILNSDALNQVWGLGDRIRCGDMESAGFSTACEEDERDRQWLIVRGISDYGTEDTRTDPNRRAGAASAAVWLRLFIETGLVEIHPNVLRVPESSESQLSQGNYYAQFDSTDKVRQRLLEKLNVDLRDLDLSGSLTLGDYESLCVARGANASRARTVLAKIREDYFTEKYLDYSYEADLRELIPNWATEYQEIVADVGIDPMRSTILDVGIGNGLEAPGLFKGASELIGVDVSRRSLRRARKAFPAGKYVHNTAEDLRDISSGSVAIYVSLRTYQSSFFDIPQALREAQRVLKERGLLVVSIANGFVEIEQGTRRVVRGLLVPGTRTITDRNTPRRIARDIEERLEGFGFQSVGYKSTKTDIYVWGQKP